MRLALRYILFSGIAFVVSTIFFSFSYAQERCGTVEYVKQHRPGFQNDRIRFEEWLTQKRLHSFRNQTRKKQTTPYKIPVVVHVIHNGEGIGSGANISDAQVFSQIRVLNEDFTRQNADASNTPPVFQDVAGSLDIEFVLAKRDPNGFPTNGIVRVDGGRNGWTINDQNTLKSLSYWPAEDYMNIWVCNLTDQFVGYAQHPESDLEGLENASRERLTDGVVIWHRAFGSADDGSFSLDPVFNKGRTTTHEVGHFFGLFHTWGDDVGCSGTDYVDDTPNQANRTQGCPSHPRTDGCGEVVMFQNFLDYTDDACMNLFTQGQAERMSIVIENSPRRSTLLTSPGLEDADPLPDDIGIVAGPPPVTCAYELAPTVVIENAGTVQVNEVIVEYSINNAAGQSTTVSGLAIPFGGQKVITLPVVSLNDGENTIAVNVTFPEGTEDNNPSNNQRTFIVVVSNDRERIPLRQDFEGDLQPLWTIVNPSADGRMNWEVTETNFGQSLYFNAFNNDLKGDESWLISPVLDLSNTSEATMLFDFAYRSRASRREKLLILASTDCGITYQAIDHTVPQPQASTANWIPENDEHWVQGIEVDLSSLLGEENVRIAFVVQNQNGNNLYLDNIEFFVTPIPDLDEAPVLFSVYGYDFDDPQSTNLQITFDLPQRQDVYFSVVNTLGQTEADGIIPDVLNQTYPLSLPTTLAPGVYFIRMQISGKSYVSRIVVF